MITGLYPQLSLRDIKYLLPDKNRLTLCYIPVERLMELSYKALRTFLVDSYESALGCVFRALAHYSSRKKVIMSFAVSEELCRIVKKAGFEITFVDMSGGTFGMDIDRVMDEADDNTVAVFCDNMFGIPVDIQKIKEAISGSTDCLVIEDISHSFGSAAGGVRAGFAADVCLAGLGWNSSLSFFRGGMFWSRREELTLVLEKAYRNMAESSIYREWASIVDSLVLSFYIRSFIKNIPISFADKGFQCGRQSVRMGHLRNRMLGFLWDRRIENLSRRLYNGTYLYEGLKRIPGVKMPDLKGKDPVVLYGFPVLLENGRDISSIIKFLRARHIAVSLPRFDIFSPDKQLFCQNAAKSFETACYLNSHMLTLPVHPGVGKADMDIMIDVIARVCG